LTEDERVTRTILIAEDEPFIVESLTFLFEREGYHVRSVTDGRSALEQVRETTPDLLVLDAMMEHFTGFDVLKMIRNDPAISATKVLMLTARGQGTDRDLAFELGADEYIAKPFANRELLAAVSRLLGD
jgi:DNA-binding response OmpR family regulator